MTNFNETGIAKKLKQALNDAEQVTLMHIDELELQGLEPKYSRRILREIREARELVQ